MTPRRRPPRRRDQLVGWTLTVALVIALTGAAGTLLVAVGLLMVAMPITTAAIATVLVWAGWRVIARRRRNRMPANR